MLGRVHSKIDFFDGVKERQNKQTGFRKTLKRVFLSFKAKLLI